MQHHEQRHRINRQGDNEGNQRSRWYGGEPAVPVALQADQQAPYGRPRDQHDGYRYEHSAGSILKRR
ncbi:hypothetical protein HRbin36_02882 [bacterium HR36]|nr:hypothetical protein HRbin36_02882 [bacterium HR36]